MRRAAAAHTRTAGPKCEPVVPASPISGCALSPRGHGTVVDMLDFARPRRSLALQRGQPQLQLVDPVPQQGDLGFQADFSLRPALNAR